MASNSSSISLVDSIQSHNSNDNINTVYNIPSTNPYLHKPVRPTKSRLRPALPNVFLQVPGSDGRSSPWKQRSEPQRQASFESTTSTMASTSIDNSISKEDQVLISEITDGMQYMGGSSPVGSNVSTFSTPAITAAANSDATYTIGHSRGFSTCFSVGSTSSLLDPGMMQVDTPKMGTTRPSTRSRGTTSDYESSSGSEYVLADWSTPRIAKTPTLRISSKDLPSLPSCSKGNNRITSASNCSIYRDRDESHINWNTDDDSDVLHIRLPASTTSSSLVVVGKKRSLSTRMQEQGSFNPEQSTIKYDENPSRASIKRKNQELKAEKQASKTARTKERNMRIKLEDPKVKNASTEIDSIFGIGKEESKAMRCGYAGLGIAYDKRTWKATDDFQSLLRDTVRSSLYNLSPRSPRSPRSTIRRKFSNAGYTPSHSPSQSRSISSPSLSSTTAEDSPAIERRKRRGPPPPLDLSSLSSFSTLGDVKTARETFVGRGKSDRRKESNFTTRRATQRENDKMEKLADDGELREMKTPRKITLKKILRSVRSISNMRGGH